MEAAFLLYFVVNSKQMLNFVTLRYKENVTSVHYVQYLHINATAQLLHKLRFSVIFAYNSLNIYFIIWKSNVPEISDRKISHLRLNQY